MVVYYSMRHIKTPQQAFNQQRRHAIKHRIPFRFTYEEWVGWWRKELGPAWFVKRGMRRGQYQMVRNRFVGVWEISNVYCAKVEQLRKDYCDLYMAKGSFHYNAKLTSHEVRAIRASPLTVKETAKAYNVAAITVYKIKSGARRSDVR